MFKGKEKEAGVDTPQIFELFGSAMQYGSQRQTGQQPPSSQSLGAPHPQSTQLIYTHGPLTAAPTRPISVHTRRHPQPRPAAIYTQVPVMQYQFNQRQPPSTVPLYPAPNPGTGPYQYQPGPAPFQTYPYYIPAQAGSLHTRGPPISIPMGHAGVPPPPQTQTTSHPQTPSTRRSNRPNALAIINPDTFENVLEEMEKGKVANEEESTSVAVVSANSDAPSVEIPLETVRRKV